MTMTPDDLTKLVSEYRAEADEAHGRLRTDLRLLEATVQSNFRHFDDQTRLVRAEIGQIAAASNAPIDAMKLVMSTKSIVALCFGIVAIVASYWSLSAKIDAQQKDAVNDRRLQEVQMKALGDAAADAKATAADAKRQYELLRYEFQSLKETVIGKDKKP